MRSPTTEHAHEPDLAQLERWTAWMSRLTGHAAALATDPGVAEQLRGATEDALWLRDALAEAARGELDPGSVAIVRSVYQLWDANHDRIERLAAVVDPVWHRRWRIRTGAARPEARPTDVQDPLTTVL